MKMSAWKCSGSMFRVSRFFHMVRMKRRRRMMKRVWVWKIGRWVGRLRWFSAIWRRRGSAHHSSTCQHIISSSPPSSSYRLSRWFSAIWRRRGCLPPPCTSLLQPGTSFHLSTYHFILPLSSSSHVSWTIICPCHHISIASFPHKAGELNSVAEGLWLGKGFLCFWISMRNRFSPLTQIFFNEVDYQKWNDRYQWSI